MNKYDDVKYFDKVLVIILSSKAKIRMVIRVENIMIVKNGSTKTNLNLKQTENTGLVQWIVLTVLVESILYCPVGFDKLFCNLNILT